MNSSLLNIPQWTPGSHRIWQRNFRYFKKTLMVTFFWVIIEPTINLLAIGLGLGAYVNNIEGSTYLEFYFPGLLCSTAMIVAFFESTYSSYSKLIHQKTYSTALLSPITIEDILFGESLWASTKSMIGVVGVLFVASCIGLGDFLNTMMALPLLFILCWFFSCFGMYITSIAKNYDFFIFFISGYIVPMSLISGTYFPFKELPVEIKYIAYLLPLTHGVDGVRNAMHGRFDGVSLMQALGLIFLSFIFMNKATNNIVKRIKS